MHACARPRTATALLSTASSSARVAPDSHAPPAPKLPDPSPTPSPPTPPNLKPGHLDSRHFTPGPSVSFWRHLDLSSGTAANTLAGRVTSSVAAHPADTPYWLYCLARTSFFALQGATSVVVSASTGDASTNRVDGLRKAAPRLMMHAGHAYADDLDRVRAGVYKMPWDVLDMRHRQARVGYVVGQARRYLREAGRVLRRRDEESEKEVWMDGEMYPEYYKNAYHYQTDGWLSTTSADAYDTQTETLFVGRQDAMQRLALCPISQFVKEHLDSTQNHDKMKVVEIAAGTGRFATFVRDNYPHFDYVISDLSPFYLQKARENMAYWETHTNIKKDAQLGSVRFLQANAENLPLRDCSVDIVYSVYLFHELPPEARVAVFQEAARILRPGGLFVMVDSVQMGDLGEQSDRNLDNFQKLNEPWYPSYVREDFGAIARKDGLFRGWTKEVCSVTKMLSFRRTSIGAD